MLNIAADHIAEREEKEAAERRQKQAENDRRQQIAVCQQIIAEAERKMLAPVFVNDAARTTYDAKKVQIERLAAEYEQRLWQERNAGRGYPLDLASEGAIAYFFGEQILEKMPLLADRISSRDGRGRGFAEEKREEIVFDCQMRIAAAKAKLESLTTPI